jgi:hypothetical protein
MSGFDRRREGFEGKFALDEEQKFKATMRRNKLLGLWAADKLGLSGTAAEEYAVTVAKSDLKEPGDNDVIGKIASDFAGGGLTISEDAIRAELEKRWHEAAMQVLGHE